MLDVMSSVKLVRKIHPCAIVLGSKPPLLACRANWPGNKAGIIGYTWQIETVGRVRFTVFRRKINEIHVNSRNHLFGFHCIAMSISLLEMKYSALCGV